MIFYFLLWALVEAQRHQSLHWFVIGTLDGVDAVVAFQLYFQSAGIPNFVQYPIRPRWHSFLEIISTKRTMMSV